MGGDGDGFARCAQGHTHWGRFGASGLLAYHRDAGGGVHVLLQQRAWWGIGGGTWGMFGGALHSHEDPVSGALRETAEECTLDTDVVTVHGVRLEDHGGWGFVSVIGSVPELVDVRPASRETSKAAWVPLEKVADKKLFPPFARSWPLLQNGLRRLVLVVDAANVVGARADGWWKDRAGANARLRDDLAALKEGFSGLPKESFPFDSYFPEIVLVVEGEARRVADEPAHEPANGAAHGAATAAGNLVGNVAGNVAGNLAGNVVRVVAAPHSGDDKIVELVGRGEDPGVAHLVVTADRELRARCEDAGAYVVGPRWLLGCLRQASPSG